jgi:hypothetical protein
MGRQNLPYFLACFFEQCGPACGLPGLEAIVPTELADVHLTFTESLHRGRLRQKVATHAVDHVLQPFVVVSGYALANAFAQAF